MRDSYVADVGDFGKYALLNALAGNDLRLAVLWCRNSLADATQDGRFTVYPELRRCDPRLYDRLSEILATNQRTLSQVENNDILPTRTLFYGTAIPAPEAPCFSDAAREAQARLRAAWLDEAFKRLSDTDMVFLDPDNGLAPSRCKKHLRSSVKYIFDDEVAAWVSMALSNSRPVGKLRSISARQTPTVGPPRPDRSDKPVGSRLIELAFPTDSQSPIIPFFGSYRLLNKRGNIFRVQRSPRYDRSYDHITAMALRSVLAHHDGFDCPCSRSSSFARARQ